VRFDSFRSAVLALTAIVALSLATAPRAGADPEQEEDRTMAMTLTSAAFDPGAEIPAKYTCDGEDVSPALGWSGVPEEAKSLVLIMDDPDAPPGTWVHWVLYDLPADSDGLPEGLPKQEKIDGVGTHGLCWGVDRFSRVGYYGPCPPPGSPHRYFFKLYALDVALALAPRATKSDVRKAMSGHVLAQAELVGTFRR
jgi:Raf kinase inhibitor-like YbhB/YbcL family protein